MTWTIYDCREKAQEGMESRRTLATPGGVTIGGCFKRLKIKCKVTKMFHPDS